MLLSSCEDNAEPTLPYPAPHRCCHCQQYHLQWPPLTAMFFRTVQWARNDLLHCSQWWPSLLADTLQGGSAGNQPLSKPRSCTAPSMTVNTEIVWSAMCCGTTGFLSFYYIKCGTVISWSEASHSTEVTPRQKRTHNPQSDYQTKESDITSKTAHCQNRTQHIKWLFAKTKGYTI